MRVLQYAFREAVASLWRGRRSGLLSTGTIALALFVLGGFLVVTTNLERLAADWGRVAAMSVYLSDGVTEAERAAVESALAPSGIVEAREYVSKALALTRFRQVFGDLSGTVDTLGGNPLPASYEVRLRPGPASAAGIDALGAALRRAPGVVDVRYDAQWLTRLDEAVRVLRRVGFALGFMLAGAAALTVASVVRLALHARRDEIEIMQLVGAPQAYVRGPFVVEGVLQGGMGALVALVALAVAFAALRGRYLIPLAAAINLSTVSFLPIQQSVLLVAGGMAVGCVGGIVASWNRRLFT